MTTKSAIYRTVTTPSRPEHEMSKHMTNEDQERAIENLIAEPTVIRAEVAAYNVNYHDLVVVTLKHLDGSESTVQLGRDGFPL